MNTPEFREPAKTLPSPAACLDLMAEHYNALNSNVTVDYLTASEHRSSLWKLGDTLAEALEDPALRPRVLSMLGAVTSEPVRTAPYLIPAGTCDWALGMMERDDVATTLISLHEADPTTDEAQEIMQLLVARTAIQRNYWGQELIAPYLEQYIPSLLEAAARQSAPEETISNARVAMATARVIGNAQDAQPLLKLAERLWRDDNTAEFGTQLMRAIADHSGSFAKLLKRWRLDAQELERAWAIGYGQDRLPSGKADPNSPTRSMYRDENVQLILDLERERPGICAILRRTHGLRNFARDTKQVLQGMFENLTKQFKHNVIVARAKSDHNGALYSRKQNIDRLFQHLTANGVGVHIVEFESLAELEQLLGMWVKHRPDEKMQVIVPIVHGLGYEVEANKTKRAKGGTISCDDLRGSGLQALMAQVAAADLVVPMDSCHATQDEKLGMGATVRQVLGATVIGPSVPAGMSLNIQAQAGNISAIEVLYLQRHALPDSDAWGSSALQAKILKHPKDGGSISIVDTSS